MDTAWESELAELLSDLLAAQDELIDVLTKKRRLLVKLDTQGLAAIGQQEQDLIERLEQCLRRREDLLGRAAAEGLPSNTIRSLTAALPRQQRGELGNQVKLANARSRLLQHHSLVNWVLVQRSLLHLAQMLEIIATGGRMQPTYDKGHSVPANGALVDREA
jgi:hypothetical protein